MRTLDAVPAEKQKRIAKETQLVYVPLAARLGMATLKTELKELAFRHIDRKACTMMRKKIDTAVGSISMKDMERKMSDVLLSEGVTNVSITSRIRNAYSTYMKMKYKKCSFEQIQDIIALRVIVDDIPTAYHVLGIIHAHWRPIPGTFKDYISLPKPNGYRTLHTRILIDQHILEIHILTYSMYQHAQFGIAAHFHYKEKRLSLIHI